MKKSILLFIGINILSIQVSYAEPFNCGKVKVESLLSGPRHGSMMRVSNHGCGADGWICLDPEAQTMSSETSKRLHSQVSSFHMANKAFYLSINDGVYATACGGNYPVVEDLRTN